MMAVWGIAASLITLAALFSYVNERWCKLPTTFGLMLIALPQAPAPNTAIFI